MAIEGCPVQFDGKVPSISEILDEIERLSGLQVIASNPLDPDRAPIDTKRAPVDLQCRSLDVAFADFPSDFAHLSVSKRLSSVLVSNETGSAPVLYRTIVHALLSLGGESDWKGGNLNFPLTPDFVCDYTREYRKDVRKFGSRVLFTVIMMLTVVISVITAIVMVAT